jgi:hypothetical protein
MARAVERGRRRARSHPTDQVSIKLRQVIIVGLNGARRRRPQPGDLQAQIPVRLAAPRDALQAQDAPRLREAAHKCCDLLSEFSTVAGDLAAILGRKATGYWPIMEDMANAGATVLDQLVVVDENVRNRAKITYRTL